MEELVCAVSACGVVGVVALEIVVGVVLEVVAMGSVELAMVGDVAGWVWALRMRGSRVVAALLMVRIR